MKNQKMHKSAREKIYEFSEHGVLIRGSFYVTFIKFIFWGKNMSSIFLDPFPDTADDAK